MTEQTPANDLTATIGRGDPILIGRIRAGTIIPRGGDGALYAAFMAKGCPLTMEEVDAALDHARQATPDTVSYPIGDVTG
mgnify:CR=1 FL=1